MKFAIGYGLADDEELPSTLNMSDKDVFIHRIDIDAPELPERFKMSYEEATVKGNNNEEVQFGYWTIELQSLNDLVDLARSLGREVLLEQQPEGMRIAFNNSLPEFCLSIGEPIEG
jgi:hypothetical protein